MYHRERLQIHKHKHTDIYFTTLQLNGSQSSDYKYWDLGFPQKAAIGIKALPNCAYLLREPNIPSSEATM